MSIIYVTQSDIDNGVIGDPLFCPIARAMRRTGYHDATVEDDAIYYRDEDSGEIVRRWSNYHMRDFVVEFDRGDTVAPFSFDIEELERW